MKLASVTFIVPVAVGGAAGRRVQTATAHARSGPGRVLSIEMRGGIVAIVDHEGGQVVVPSSNVCSGVPEVPASQRAPEAIIEAKRGVA